MFTNSKFKTMAISLQQQFGQSAVSAACLLLLSQKLFHKITQDQGVNLRPLLELQHACVAAWLESEGVPPTAVENALVGLEQAALSAIATPG